MRMSIKTLVFVLLTVAPGLAQGDSIRQLFESVISKPAGDAGPTQKELFTKVNENTVGALAPSEVNAVLPLAKQCLLSANPQTRQDGLVLFMAVSLRPDSAQLLEPYIDDLGALVSGPEGAISLRHGALYILGSTKPHVSPKAISYLNAHLEDSRNSNEETLTIAASLLEASPSDTATLRKVLDVATRRGDPGLSSGVIRTLGLSKTRHPEALNFLGASLSGSNRFLRESAVEAVSRLERDVRSQFTAQLARIAADPSESEHARAQARQALK